MDIKEVRDVTGAIVNRGKAILFLTDSISQEYEDIIPLLPTLIEDICEDAERLVLEYCEKQDMTTTIYFGDIEGYG